MVKDLIKLILNYFFFFIAKILQSFKLLNFTIKIFKNVQLGLKKNFEHEINKILNNKKILFLDIGSRGGLEPELEQYRKYFDIILVDPNMNIDFKILDEKKIIPKALWSSCDKKIFNITKTEEGSSFYTPNENGFKFYFNSSNYFNNYKIITKKKFDCSTIEIELNKLNISQIDFIKIDTQGSEFEIIKGIGNNFKSLFIKCEVQILPLYKDVPLWSKILNVLDDLDYISINMISLGASEIHMPVEADMYFIPNFFKNKNIFKNRESNFISLMCMHNQIRPLKIISKILNFKYRKIIEKLEDSYFY